MNVSLSSTSAKRPRSSETSVRRYRNKVPYKTNRFGKASGAFAKKVKAVLQREAEKKQVQYYATDHLLVSYNYTGGWANYIFPVTPNGATLTISQGAGDSGRVGNRIKIASAKFRGIMFPTAYNVTSNPTPLPYMIRVWLLYDKENPSTVPNPGSDFLQLGGSSLALSGTVADMIATVNSDRWVVKYDKVFKLGFADYSGTGTNAAFQSATNNDFKLVNQFEIDFTKMIPSTYVFDDNTSNPETRGLYFVAELVGITGAAISTAVIGAEMHYSVDIRYTDL